MKPYKTDPRYIIIADRLYYITREGKYLYIRDATLLDYENIYRRKNEPSTK